MRHFRAAIESVRPTITDEIRTYYEDIVDEFTGGTAEPGRHKGRIGFQ